MIFFLWGGTNFIQLGSLQKMVHLGVDNRAKLHNMRL